MGISTVALGKTSFRGVVANPVTVLVVHEVAVVLSIRFVPFLRGRLPLCAAVAFRWLVRRPRGNFVGPISHVYLCGLLAFSRPEP